MHLGDVRRLMEGFGEPGKRLGDAGQVGGVGEDVFLDVSFSLVLEKRRKNWGMDILGGMWWIFVGEIG